jgi:hypothetical protein
VSVCSYDCRRVVLASLSNASNIRPLFLRDPEAPSEQRWKIGPRGDDLGIKLDELPFVDVSQKLGGAASARLRTARQKRVRSVSPSDAKRSRGDAAATAAAGAANSVVQSTLANLSPEQHAVASYLYHCADVAANIADIVIVLQRAGYVTSSGSRTEARRQAELILEVEPGFTPFVTRAANDKWALVNELVEELDDANADDESSESGDDDGAGDADDDSSTTPTAKRSRSRSPANTADTFADEVHVHHSTTTAAAPPPPPPQQQHQQQQSHHQQQQSHHTGSSAPPSGSSLSVIFGEGDVSAMQETLMGIVLEHGGSALLETISELAAQRIPSIRKKNMDVRRSIVASLSHNPPGFFRKHARKPGFWTITPRGRLLAEAMMNSSADRAKYSLDDAASGSD